MPWGLVSPSYQQNGFAVLQVQYILHDDIVGGYAIGSNEQEGLGIHFVKISYLPLGDLGEAVEGGGCQDWVCHG